MSFSLRTDLYLKNILKDLKKIMKSEHYKLLEARLGQSGALIETWDQEFMPILARWSFETNIRFCTEHGIFSLLETGKTVKELLFDLNWKNEAMLQDLLDTLVDQEILRKKQREYSPFTFSALLSIHELGLREIERRLISRSPDYRTIFSFYNQLHSDHILESMITGQPTATLRGVKPSRLSLLFDILLKTSVYIIPRLSAVAVGIARCDPKTILHLNCSTGRGTEEILLCQPDAEHVLGVDMIPYQVELAKQNIDTFQNTHSFQANVEFHVIDYSRSLTEQLREDFKSFDMILLDQLPMWVPHEAHASLIQEIWGLLRRNGVIALNQPLRPSPACPWPNEWIFRTLDGFSGFPVEFEFLKLFSSRLGAPNRSSSTSLTIIPTMAYLVYA